MKRATITWHRMDEVQPPDAGMYLITVKVWPASDPYRVGPWDGKTTAVAFDRWLPGGRPHIVRGYWWAVKADNVIAWAELPKPYSEEEPKKKRAKN